MSVASGQMRHNCVGRIAFLKSLRWVDAFLGERKMCGGDNARSRQSEAAAATVAEKPDNASTRIEESRSTATGHRGQSIGRRPVPERVPASAGRGGAGAGRVRGGKTIRASERRRRSTDSYSDSTHPADASIYIGSKWRRTRQRLYDDDSLTRSGRFTEQGPGVTGHLPPRVSAPSPEIGVANFAHRRIGRYRHSKHNNSLTSLNVTVICCMLISGCGQHTATCKRIKDLRLC